MMVRNDRQTHAVYQLPKVKQTGEGLQVTAVVATIGERLRYPSLGRDEYPSEQALFGNLEQFEGLPITLDHPSSGLLREGDHKALVQGTVKAAYRSGNRLMAVLSITGPKAVEAVQSGRYRAVSAGYTTNLEMQGGKWVQVTRTMDHLSLVQTPRARSAVIQMDAQEDYARGQFDGLRDYLPAHVLAGLAGKSPSYAADYCRGYLHR